LEAKENRLNEESATKARSWDTRFLQKRKNPSVEKFTNKKNRRPNKNWKETSSHFSASMKEKGGQKK